MLKAVLFTALVGAALSLTCLDKAGASSNCDKAKCYKPKFTEGTGFVSTETGYGCNTCADRKAELTAAGKTINGGTDCEECATNDCNTVIKENAKKCHTYKWNAGKTTFEKQAAALCTKKYTETKWPGCIAPADLTKQADFPDNGGCDAEPTSLCNSKTCLAGKACKEDSCNVATTKKCYTFKWDATATKYKQSKDAVVCGKLFEMDFKCNKPASMTVKADYKDDEGCGACPAGAKCDKTVCTTDSCNSAAAMFTLIPALLAALYSLF
jgi:hypothetical protein